MTSSVNAPGLVDVPISTWGWTFLMTDKRSRSSSGHPSSSRAKGFWPSVNLSPSDFTRRPGLSIHLGEKVVLAGVLSPSRGYIPDLLRRFILRHPSLSSDRIRNLVGNASTSCARAKDYHSHIFQFNLADLKGSQHSSECDTPCSLDVVIETRYLRLIPIEYSPCIVQAKILTDIVSSVSNNKEPFYIQVYVSLRESFAGSLYKSIHKFIVLLPSDPTLPQAKIECVIEQLFVLCMLSTNIDSTGE